MIHCLFCYQFLSCIIVNNYKKKSPQQVMSSHQGMQFLVVGTGTLEWWFISYFSFFFLFSFKNKNKIKKSFHQSILQRYSNTIIFLTEHVFYLINGKFWMKMKSEWKLVLRIRKQQLKFLGHMRKEAITTEKQVKSSLGFLYFWPCSISRLHLEKLP